MQWRRLRDCQALTGMFQHGLDLFAGHTGKLNVKHQFLLSFLQHNFLKNILQLSQPLWPTQKLYYHLPIKPFARRTQTRSRLRWNDGACWSSLTTSFNSARASSGWFLAR